VILCHPHRFIFLKSTKTAGTSLEIALSKYCGADDIITPIVDSDEAVRRALGHRGPQHFRKPLAEYGLRDWLKLLGGRRVKKYYHHIPASELQRLLPAEVWQGYFKFSIVRNPYDYAVSRYFWSTPKAAWSNQDFRRFLPERQDLLLKNRGITHIDGRSAVDFMVRYEHFEEDLGRIAERTGLPAKLHAEFAALSAKKGIRPPTASTAEMFAGFDEGLALVRTLCAEDIETFGYTLPSA
jgi:hypothetical protein